MKKYNPYIMEMGKYKLNIGEKTWIMGILNATPDSFSDGGQYNTIDSALEHAKEMFRQGADIIDVGGESTRPGAQEVLEKEEIQRVVPIIKALKKHINLPISIDTYKANVAKEALMAGADMINDVWGLQREPKIAKIAAQFNVPVCVMHNQKGTDYTKDIIKSIKDFFVESIEIAEKAGIKKENIILDPGIGFGKTPEQNLEVMSRLSELNSLGYPILLGTSRKSMIGYVLDLPSNERVEGTIATNVIGAQAGVEFVRVHDVKEHVRALKVTDAIYRR